MNPAELERRAVSVMRELAGMSGSDKLQAVVEDPSLLEYVRVLLDRLDAQDAELKRLRELEAAALDYHDQAERSFLYSCDPFERPAVDATRWENAIAACRAAQAAPEGGS